ncbi:gustatory receptor for sugar taste 64f-like isoform X1 [Galleria mellonella]|uniref:Gustatory receptor n=1 Tax=Galleria mellonella TaxID=7137 RepID=A0ABM3MQR7_GALME|nr:gustatory receptor for sugar taste 64f-like isoform X1 [Galleria mellonella]XP_052753722.1 gustatory receptor for sugar taste 64f-like isoform X1 [Galleria mellonella]
MRLKIVKTKSRGLHAVIRWTLLCGRIMGLLPLNGLTNQRIDGLRFTLLSPYSLIYLASLFGQVTMFYFSFRWFLENNMSIANFTNLLFHTLSMASVIILANIGRRWSKLMVIIETIEHQLPPQNRNVAIMCNVAMIVVLTLASVEHLLAAIYGYSVARACNNYDVTETFLHYGRPWVFTYTTYSLWKGILYEIYNIQSTFLWSYNDVIIIVISIYLSEHFVQHNQLLKKAIRQEHFACDELRLQYMKIARLVKLVNDHIGVYIMTCFGSNFYWICVQLFYSLNKSQTGRSVACHSKHDKSIILVNDTIEHTIYFTYSVSFLIARAITVLMMAARVHSTSNVPLTLLYEIPGSKYNIEVERFMSQLNNIKVALTGLDFFYVTRTMVLSLFGNIITYELVLLQFNK